MADAVTSPVKSRQMIGRVSRKAPGKQCGYVLIPMPLTDVVAMAFRANEVINTSNNFELVTTTRPHSDCNWFVTMTYNL